MVAQIDNEKVHTIHIVKEVEIDAPIEITFQAVLHEMGPGSEMPDGTAFPMKIEARPGGRWYRDLGNDAGHLWGHVQVIKPPKLIEISGPMFMSYPAVSHVQYRLVEEGDSTRLTITHRAMGLIPKEHRESVHEGWDCAVRTIRKIAESMRDGAAL